MYGFIIVRVAILIAVCSDPSKTNTHLRSRLLFEPRRLATNWPPDRYSMGNIDSDCLLIHSHNSSISSIADRIWSISTRWWKTQCDAIRFRFVCMHAIIARSNRRCENYICFFNWNFKTLDCSIQKKKYFIHIYVHESIGCLLFRTYILSDTRLP